MNEERLGLYSDFIGEYHNVIDNSFCRDVIKAFDYYHDIGSVWCENQQFIEGNAGRFDWAIDMIQLQRFMDLNDAAAKFNQVLWSCWKDYVTEYGHLSVVPMYSIHHKVQKTPAGGGYHVWHDERSDMEHCQRCAVWMMYLNDDYEGGELVINGEDYPLKKGELVIFPSNFMYMHKVNPVLSGKRFSYVAWSW